MTWLETRGQATRRGDVRIRIVEFGVRREDHASKSVKIAQCC
jgi:hypothetical protein